MKVLRSLGESTRLLILLETSMRHHGVQRTIAEALGMTVQGVSAYLGSMETAGLIHSVGGEYRPTIEGIRVLHERFRELRDFVDRTSKELSIIEVTAALAGARVQRGDAVGLFMEGGELVAYPGRDSPSKGTAIGPAEKGDDVGVTRLEGIVSLSPGRISLLRVRSVSDGGSRGVDLGRARRSLRRIAPDVVAVLGPSARALAARLRMRPDIRFGAVAASLDAAERGLDVALVLSEDRVAAVVAALEDANEGRAEKIPYDTAGLG